MFCFQRFLRDPDVAAGEDPFPAAVQDHRAAVFRYIQKRRPDHPSVRQNEIQFLPDEKVFRLPAGEETVRVI